ncbi:hypothetical protein HBB16_07005 [Pseudonocardia sp. MCCB 268]|nr:hypothetical protein [Pseudonocardia cytotoxica]
MFRHVDLGAGGWMRSKKRVLQGLAFVTVIAVLLGLSVAQYAGLFSRASR